MIHIKQTIFRRALEVLLAGSALFVHLSAQAEDPSQAQSLPTVPLNAGIHRINVMVARTPDERQTGLMFRQSMGTNEGMLFVFETATRQCFWMKNTLLPLSAAFIDDEGRIVNIADMAPQSLDSHCSDQPVRFVLEMNQGWFAKKGLQKGARIGGITGR